MGKFTVNHTINCNEETFWKIFFDKEFNETLFKTELGFPEYVVVDQRDTETQITRKVAATPKMNMPGPVQKLLGSGFRYTEEGSYTKSTKLWVWKMTPSTMADKLKQEGTLRIERVGDDKVRRIAELVMEAKIFGIGGLIESSVEKQLREGWDQSAAYMNKWIVSHPG